MEEGSSAASAVTQSIALAMDISFFMAFFLCFLGFSGLASASSHLLNVCTNDTYPKFLLCIIPYRVTMCQEGEVKKLRLGGELMLGLVAADFRRLPRLGQSDWFTLAA